MPTIDSGDTAFVLISAALVLLMSPGLAFFYGGLVRGKSVLNTMLMTFASMCVVGVAWLVVGYSLAFAQGPEALSSFVGGFGHLGLTGVGAAPASDTATIPHSAFMLFQAMFAILTPALIAGAVVERMKFSAFLLFILGWSLLVYSPVAHWVWSEDGWLFKLGALDFAGGAVVHINAGAAALAAALVLGPRKGFPRAAMLPHNVPFVLLGTGLLWFGWMGFNGGSALAANGLAASAFVATFGAAAMGGTTWGLLEQLQHRRMTAVGFSSGIVAGLVGITPAAGFVTPMAALLIGFGAAGVSFFAIRLKAKVGLDDSLDVFGIHGIAGIFGAVATGALATTLVNPDGADGSLKLVGIQAAASFASLAYSGVASFGLLKLVDALVGLRIDEAAELEGIDVNEHGERGYVGVENAGVRVETPEPEIAIPVTQAAAERNA